MAKPPPPTVPDGAAPVPRNASLSALREAAAGCKRCPLWKHATQTVFGEGPARARILVVGEQPGDKEDIEGRPFVGPAGRLFDQALDELGIDRKQCRNVPGNKFRLMQERGQWQTLPNGAQIVATVHPSFVLRQRDSASRATAYRDFVADLAALLDATSSK